jgi:ElaB/YqjD/DUF883 family membrane-anchored ribosome-binding protein
VERAGDITWKISSSVANSLGISDIASHIADLLDKASNVVYDWAQRTVSAALPQMEKFGEVLHKVQEVLMRLDVGEMAGLASNATEAAMEFAGDPAEDIVEGAQELFEDAQELAEDLFEDATEAANSIFGGLKRMAGLGA